MTAHAVISLFVHAIFKMDLFTGLIPFFKLFTVDQNSQPQNEVGVAPHPIKEWGEVGLEALTSPRDEPWKRCNKE